MAAVGLVGADGGGRHLADAREDGARRRHDRVPAHVVLQGHPVDGGVDAARGEERGQGGGEAQRPLRLAVVERLDPEPVADEGDAARRAVMEREGEHAVEAGDGVGAPLGPGLEDHLGIARGGEAVAEALEFAAKLGIIVDAAVERDRVAEAGIDEGLGGGVGQVDDLQPAVTEGDAPAHDHSRPVGAARGHDIRHALDARRRRHRAVESHLAADATHMPGLASRLLPLRGLVRAIALVAQPFRRGDAAIAKAVGGSDARIAGGVAVTREFMKCQFFSHARSGT